MLARAWHSSRASAISTGWRKAGHYNLTRPAMSDDLIPKLKCARCGGKQVGLTYTPTEMQRVDVSDYRKAWEGR
ncbi:MAG: hypothetical protein E5X86_22630 [Mesorhizobium sp.]|nr:MAG: hypothetical protein E5X86_22630 [Mesorhizobium sp.]